MSNHKSSAWSSQGSQFLQMKLPFWKLLYVKSSLPKWWTLHTNLQINSIVTSREHCDSLTLLQTIVHTDHFQKWRHENTEHGGNCLSFGYLGFAGFCLVCGAGDETQGTQPLNYISIPPTFFEKGCHFVAQTTLQLLGSSEPLPKPLFIRGLKWQRFISCLLTQI